jgi:hypothetical protein
MNLFCIEINGDIQTIAPYKQPLIFDSKESIMEFIKDCVLNNARELRLSEAWSCSADWVCSNLDEIIISGDEDYKEIGVLELTKLTTLEGFKKLELC